ncbi:MAG: hypothetical protein MI824_13285 [Hyphomicrobiales bacterium]|nr:hypothetical protein [Hyphomicrobiales bacterium]
MLGLALVVGLGAGAAAAGWERDAVKDQLRDTTLLRATNADGVTFVVSCRTLVGVTDWLIGVAGPLPPGVPRQRLSDEAAIVIDGAVQRWPDAFGLKLGRTDLRLGRQLLVGPYDPPWIKGIMDALSGGRTLTFRLKLSGHAWSWPLAGFAESYAKGGFGPCTGG